MNKSEFFIFRVPKIVKKMTEEKARNMGIRPSDLGRESLYEKIGYEEEKKDKNTNT